MGNHRFRLSDMIPNAWFYKLRDMNKPRNHNSATATSTKKGLISSVSTATSSSSPSNPKHYHYHYSTATSHSTNSYYYTPRPNQIYNSAPRTNPLPDPPRKSSRRKRKSIYKPSPPPPPKPESTHPDPAPDHSSNESTQSLTCKISSSSTDIIIDVTGKLYETESKFKGHFGFVSDINIDLPPIITKPKPNSNTPARKSLSGMRVRGNSPRVVSKKIQRAAGGGGGGGGGHYCNKSSSKSKTPSASMAAQQQQQQKTTAKKKKKKSFSESLAIVKSSFDPQKDFRESMVEMIVENNIRASKDLEELLACYLSLNSDEYHDLIVKAFEQIWFSLPDF